MVKITKNYDNDNGRSFVVIISNPNNNTVKTYLVEPFQLNSTARSWWPRGLERQFQIQIEAHSKIQVRIPLEDDTR